MVVVVIAQGPQSCGQVEQSSDGPHSPSPHVQLQGGDPSVQLQAPAVQSARICRTHARLSEPVRPEAAISSAHAA